MALKCLGAGMAPQTFYQGNGVYGFEWDFNLPSGTYPLIAVPQGDVVTGVDTVVTTAFDGTPTAKIGDTDSTAGYLQSTDIAPATASTVTTPAVKKSSGIANAYQNGKPYLTAGRTVDLVWVKGTSPTAGVLKGAITISPWASSLGNNPSATSVA